MNETTLKRKKKKKDDRAKFVSSTTKSPAPELPLKEGDETELALIAATLANRQLQLSKSLSTYHATENKLLRRGHDQLENVKSKAEEDAFTAIEALEKQLDAVKCDNARLKHEVDNALVAARQEVEEEMSSLRGALKERDLSLMELQERVKWLEGELEGVEVFRDARDAHKSEVEALKKAYAEEKASRKASEQSLRLHLMEERVRLRADEKLLKKKHMEDVSKMAMDLLGEKTREVDELNQNLLEERAFLLTDAETARKQAEALQQQNNKLRLDAVLTTSTEAEFTAHCARQKREISALKAQVKTVEDNFDGVVKKYEKQLQKQAKEHSASVRQLTKERDEARHAAKSIRRELAKLRSLSKQMVDRRTDLELFFYEALAHVRMAMLQERREQIQTIDYRHGAPSFPRLNTRLKGGNDKLLLISDREMRPSMLPPLQPCDDTENSALQKKGLPSRGDRSPGQSPLPLILLPREDHLSSHGGRLAPAKKSQDSESCALTNQSTTVSGRSLFGNSNFSQIPSVPNMKDLQSIEISQLSWKDKERVLQILFKQLQGKSGTVRPKQCTSTSDVEFLQSGVAVNPMADTFLTE